MRSRPLFSWFLEARWAFDAEQLQSELGKVLTLKGLEFTLPLIQHARPWCEGLPPGTAG